MKKLMIFVFVLTALSSFAQKGYDIQINIKNYDNDTLLLAYFYGEQQLIKDTVFAKEPGVFEYKGDTLLEPGVYIALVYPSKEYFQFMVNSEDQKFKIYTDYKDLQNIKIKGSKDNKLFFEYLAYIKEQNNLAQKLLKEKSKLDSLKQDTKAIDDKLQNLDEEVGEYQQKIIKKHPDLLTSLLIKSNIDIDIPDFEGSEKEVNEKRYRYYYKHYFDNLDLKHPAVLRTPYIHRKIEDFIDKMTVPVADSISKSIDLILSKMPPQSDIWKYYVSYFLNKYAKSNIIGMDAVFVHMAQNYYGKGLTPWVEEKQLIRILDSAIRMEGVLIGKTAPELTLNKEDHSPVRLKDIKSDYTVLFFWKPDCGHCRHSMPDLIKFSDEYKDKGVTVMTICTKLGKKSKKCWEGVKELKMQGIPYNLADEKNQSGFHANYNIRATPTVFILDKDKKILIKQIPTDKLGEVMDSIMKENSEKQ